MASKPTIIAFDAYGTLLSTSSIASKLSSHFGDSTATTIATTWRKYQLEYTWRLNSMAAYEDFSSITLQSLKHALAESSVSLSDKDIQDLMSAYDQLSTFPDVVPALKKLKTHQQNGEVKAVVFSNGTDRMVGASVRESPDLKPVADVFAEIVTVEEIKRFKPAKEVYGHLAQKVGVDKESREEMGRMWLVSGNPFDVVGARAVGMQAAWVDRQGNGWQDQLVQGELGRPTVICKDLEEVVDAIMKA